MVNRTIEIKKIYKKTLFINIIGEIVIAKNKKYFKKLQVPQPLFIYKPDGCQTNNNNNKNNIIIQNNYFNLYQATRSLKYRDKKNI